MLDHTTPTLEAMYDALLDAPQEVQDRARASMFEALSHADQERLKREKAAFDQSLIEASEQVRREGGVTLEEFDRRIESALAAKYG